jgi:hypothetical protein
VLNTDELIAMHFQLELPNIVKIDISLPDPYDRGPFCRLRFTDSAPLEEGLYCWSVDQEVMHVGRSECLRQVVRGATMNRAYNDYTYIPPSQVKRPHDPRVRINGLLNQAITDGGQVGWWWLRTDGSEGLEQRLIRKGGPPWNRTHAYV